jgi:hypothetical protein
VRGHVVVDRTPREGIRRDELARRIDLYFEPGLLERLAPGRIDGRLPFFDATARRIERGGPRRRILQPNDQQMPIGLADGRRTCSLLLQAA